MISTLLKNQILTAAVAIDTDIAVVTACMAEYEDDPFGVVYQVDRRKCTLTEIGIFPIKQVGLCLLSEKGHQNKQDKRVLVVGDWGDVRVIDFNGLPEKPIISEELISDRCGPLTCARSIDNSVVAVGGSSQVWFRDKSAYAAVWRDISPAKSMLDGISTSLLTSVDGFASDDIYVTGFGGYIWHYDGSSWSFVKTKTDLGFYDICCAPDGRVYACGQGGILAVGRGTEFEIIQPEKELIDLLSIVWHRGEVFCSGYTAVLKLVDAALKPVPEAMDYCRQYLNLFSLDESLWLFAYRDMVQFHSGQWKPLDSDFQLQSPWSPEEIEAILAQS